MTRRIVIAGASGFMGTRFTELFRADGDEVVTIGRRAGAGHSDVAWGDEAGIASLVDGSHLVLEPRGQERQLPLQREEQGRDLPLAARDDRRAGPRHPGGADAASALVQREHRDDLPARATTAR